MGMGKELYENHRVAKDVFDEVDETLNRKLSDIIFNGPDYELTNTVNAQPALMAVSIALVRVLEFESKNKFYKIADIVSGHSLGEYSALCSINSIKLKDTAKLLQIRGEAMHQSSIDLKTKMTAIIGMDCQEVEKILSENCSEQICEIANDNCPGQLVISGHSKLVEEISLVCKQNGARLIIDLNVSAPFHCSLMNDVSLIMDNELKKFQI